MQTLADRLKSDQPEGNQEEQGNFYFQHLAHLEIDILIAQIEVNDFGGRLRSTSAKSGLLKIKSGLCRPKPRVSVLQLRSRNREPENHLEQ